MAYRQKLPVDRRSFLKGGAALGISLGLSKPGFAQSGEVNFYNWDTYIGPDTLENFEDETGIGVQYDLFASNDEMFAKLRGGNPGYDLIVPTNDYVERMITAEMLQPLDHSLIPNIENIDPAFMNEAEFDPGRKYSLPYMWGTIGIGYRKSAVEKEPDSWALLYDSDQYSGRIAMLNESTTVLQMALKLMGHSINEWPEDRLEAAQQMIIDQKRHIAAFAPDNGQDLLLSGEVDLVQEWNGDMLQVIDIDDDLGYVLPKEGGLRWEDTLAIPTGAPNVENAHKLINHLLNAETGAAIAEYIYYATPNKAAKALMSDDYINNPAIYPSEEALANSQYAVYPGQDAMQRISAAWTRIKAAG